MHLLLIKNGKTKLTRCGKLMTEFQSCNQLDPGATNINQGYKSRKMVLNQAQAVKIKLRSSRNVLG